MTNPPSRDFDDLTAAIVEDVSTERYESLQGPDTASGREMASVVGVNLVKEREARSLSLESLAADSGIAVDLLTEFERGETIPSMRALWSLATALGIPFGQLLTDGNKDEPPSDFRVQRASEGRIIASADNLFRSRVLFAEGDPRTPEVYELTLLPGCLEEASAHGDGSYEHLTVLEGKLEVSAGEDRVLLQAGDSIFFHANRQHSYQNPGQAPSRAMLTIRNAAPTSG